jgi:hypothetical protein
MTQKAAMRPRNHYWSLFISSYKVDSLTKNEKSKQHEKCALVTKAKLKSQEESSAAKIIQTLNKDIFIKRTFKLPFFLFRSTGRLDP